MVSELGFGASRLASRGVSRARASAAIHEALAGGVTLIDTSDSYGDGGSERIVGEAIRGHGADVVVATKVGYRSRVGRLVGASQSFSTRHILNSADASLRRLGLERIDLYLLHSPPPEHLEEA